LKLIDPAFRAVVNDPADVPIGLTRWSTRVTKNHMTGGSMASDLSFVEYVRDQISGAGQVSFKKMFGEFAIYCDGKVVALVCDNQLFVKPTDSGRASLEEVVEAAPYPGAKPYWLIGEQLDDQRSIANLIALTASALPVPKPRKAKSKKADR